MNNKEKKSCEREPFLQTELCRSILGSSLPSITKNAGYLLFGQLLIKFLRFIYAVILARYLGPELYGLFNYGLSWYLAFLPLTGFGIGIILSREVGRNRIQGDHIVQITLTIRTVLAFSVALICYFIGHISEEITETKVLFLIFSIGLIGHSITIWTDQVFTAYEINKYSFRQQAIFRPLEVVLGTVALACDGGLIAVVLIHSISWWAQAISGLELVRRNIVEIRINFAWLRIKDILIKGIQIGLCVVIVSWLQQGPLILFRHTSDIGITLGQVALAFQAFIIISAAPMAVVTASFPVLSRIVKLKTKKENMFSELMLKGSFIFGTAAGLVGMGAGSWFVNIVFGERYSEAGHLLGLSLWLLIPWAAGNAIWRVFLARSQILFPTMCASAGAIALTVSMTWFVRALGAAGAVIAAGVALMTWTASLIVMLVKSDGLNLNRTILRPAIVVLLALAIFFVLEEIHIWLSLCASLIALFSGMVFGGILTLEERSIFKEFLNISN